MLVLVRQTLSLPESPPTLAPFLGFVKSFFFFFFPSESLSDLCPWLVNGSFVCLCRLGQGMGSLHETSF